MHEGNLEKIFEITACDSSSSARAGIINTSQLPKEKKKIAPVASQRTVKGLPHDIVHILGAQLILVN